MLTLSLEYDHKDGFVYVKLPSLQTVRFGRDSGDALMRFIEIYCSKYPEQSHGQAPLRKTEIRAMCDEAYKTTPIRKIATPRPTRKKSKSFVDGLSKAEAYQLLQQLKERKNA